MKTFEDLKFEILYPLGAVRTREFFHNGYGISVIKSPFSYGGDDGLYECAVLKGTKRNYHICYKTPITNDVIGWCTPEMVTNIMKQIQELCTYY